jgi:hypothetical protein
VTRIDRRSMARPVVDHEGDRDGIMGAEPLARHLAFFSRCRDGGVASFLWGRIESPKAVARSACDG